MGTIFLTTAEINRRYSDYYITPEGGIAFKFINATGASSVKGTVVAVSNTVPNAVNIQVAEFDAVGVIYDDGVANGEEVWVVTNGIAEVLLEDGTGSVLEAWVQASPVDGRALATTPPTGIPDLITGEHFKEIGHCLEAKTGGTSVLCKIAIHFN